MKAFTAAFIIGLVALLLVGIQQYRVIALRAEAQRNADYLKDLSKRIKASEEKAKKARKDFEELKRNSKPVRDWAVQPLPNGLRGKAPGSDKDYGCKN